MIGVVLTIVIIAFCYVSCNAYRINEEGASLIAYRTAPLGAVSLVIYEDSTFEFALLGLTKKDTDVYKGKVEIRNDSLFFTYADIIPRAGKTAIFVENFVRYIDGEYPESLEIIFPKPINQK